MSALNISKIEEEEEDKIKCGGFFLFFSFSFIFWPQRIFNQYNFKLQGQNECHTSVLSTCLLCGMFCTDSSLNYLSYCC